MAGALISLTEVKQHLRVTHTREDTLIATYLAAALADLDAPSGWLGRALTEREFVQTFSGSCTTIMLRYPPIVSITSVEARAAEDWAPVDPATYEVVGRRLVTSAISSRPAGEIRITYRAGYDPDAERPLPFNLKAAILLMVGDLYENRTTREAPRSTTAERLLRPLQVFA